MNRRTIGLAAAVVGLGAVGAAFWSLSRTAATNAQAERVAAQAEQALERQDYNNAVAPLRELARLRPEAVGILPDLSRSVQRSSQRRALLKEAEERLANDPDDPVALAMAAGALAGRDDEQKRLRYLRRLVELRPDETLFRVTLAQDLVNSYLLAEAKPHLESLIRTQPDDPAAYVLRGRATAYETPTPEGLERAAADFEKALELNPRLAIVHLHLGRAYLKMGKPPEAIEHLTEAAAAMPGNADVHFALADAFRAVGDREMAGKAQAAFVTLREQALLTEGLVKKCGAFPNDFELHLKTARQLIRKGDLEKAIYYVNRALTLRPNDPQGEATARELDSLLVAGGGR